MVHLVVGMGWDDSTLWVTLHRILPSVVLEKSWRFGVSRDRCIGVTWRLLDVCFKEQLRESKGIFGSNFIFKLPQPTVICHDFGITRRIIKNPWNPSTNQSAESKSLATQEACNVLYTHGIFGMRYMCSTLDLEF